MELALIPNLGDRYKYSETMVSNLYFLGFIGGSLEATENGKGMSK